MILSFVPGGKKPDTRPLASGARKPKGAPIPPSAERRRELRVSKVGFSACQRCALFATLRTLDLGVQRRPARKDAAGIMRPELPAGWCPLIALCGQCWTDVVAMLRAKATPDSSGEVSP